MLHYCPHQSCAGLDPDNFRSNRKEVNNMDFLDKSKIFSYRTIGLGETIRNPIKTFREFSRYVGRMANRKASGDDKMPADLFKKAQEAFRKRAWILINIILAVHYACSEEPLEARVVLLCKDHGNPTLLANIDRLHYATLSTNLSISLLLVGSKVSLRNILCWNPRNMIFETLDRFNLSSKSNAGS